MSLNGVFLAQIAQQSLPYLQNFFAPLAGITTDFSTDISSAGKSVTTRFAVKPSVTDIKANGYAAVAGDTVAKEIVLDQHQGVNLEFPDIDVLQSSIKFEQLFLAPMLESLGGKVFTDLWNLVTAANFAETPLSSSAANFDRSDVIDLATQLTSSAKAPQMGRSLIVNPAYYGALSKTFISAEIPGITPFKAENTVPRISGFNVYQSDLCDANGESLAGFAMHPSALLMAARRVNPEAALRDSIDISEVVVPGLNLPVTFREFYDRKAGATVISVSVIYGVAKGTNMGVRIVTP